MKKNFHKFFEGYVSVKSAFILMIVTGFCVCVCSCAVFYLVMHSSSASGGEFSRLEEAARTIKNNYYGDADANKMTDAAISAMLGTLGDKWSYYVPLDETSSFSDKETNTYVGIGISAIATDSEGLLVTKVISSGGAYSAGITSGCHIIAVGGESIIGYTLDDSVALIKGEAGTTVDITYKDTSENEHTCSIKREKLENDPVSAELIGDIGYITIANFNENSSASFINKVDDMMGKGAKALVFDVRFNGGGRAVELCKMLDYLLPECTIFVSQDKDGKRYTTESDAKCVNIPCTVLVNRSSYSAAEYFAAVLQEYGRAEIVGQATVGKGFSQIPMTLSDGSVLSISTQAYFTPAGVSLEGVGITPDHVLEVSNDEYYSLYIGTLAHENDQQLQLALSIARGKIS